MLENVFEHDLCLFLWFILGGTHYSAVHIKSQQNQHKATGGAKLKPTDLETETMWTKQPET